MNINYINKLISIGSPAIGDRQVDINMETVGSFGKLAQQLLQMLALSNGFYAFESALHVFPATSAVRGMSISRWNADELWKFEYNGIADDKLFFAEEAFGNQFCIFSNRIYLFDAETGELDFRANSLSEWAEIVLTDYGMQTGYPLMREWQNENGRIESNHRLMPKIPFVLGGQYKIENLYSLEAVSGMKSRGNLAKQIRDLPDGSKIHFRIID